MKAVRSPCRRSAVLALALIASLALGCNTSATIERRSGPAIVGTIEPSDASRLRAIGDRESWFLDRRDVVHIRHPGAIGVYADLVAILGGTALFAVEGERSNYGLAVLGFGVVLVAAPLWLFDMAVYARSVAAARPAPAR
jgi:hypothetical protein